MLSNLVSLIEIFAIWSGVAVLAVVSFIGVLKSSIN